MIARIVYLAFNVYTLGLIVYAILLWLRSPRTDSVAERLAQYYEPLLRRIRDTVKPVPVGGSLIDLSPGILLVALLVVRQLVVSLLMSPL